MNRFNSLPLICQAGLALGLVGAVMGLSGCGSDSSEAAPQPSPGPPMVLEDVQSLDIPGNTLPGREVDVLNNWLAHNPKRITGLTGVMGGYDNLTAFQIMTADRSNSAPPQMCEVVAVPPDYEQNKGPAPYGIDLLQVWMTDHPDKKVDTFTTLPDPYGSNAAGYIVCSALVAKP